MDRRLLKVFYCLIGLFLLIALMGFALNLKGLTARSTVHTVSFSRESGFYGEAFDLELYGGGEAIYYTLDCTDPDEHSLRYTGPIRIEDASANENVYSMIRDVSIEYYPELLAASGSSMNYGYDLPRELVDKATVVRAVCIDEKGEKSAATTAVYFVDYDDKEGYLGMRVVSISTDPKNLFDPEKGMYVLGKTFTDTLVDGNVVLPMDNNYGTWPANYKNKGRDWECEAYVCCFDENRAILFSGNYGLRIQGGTSRSMLPKSLNLFARKQYGAGSFSAEELFGTPGRLDSINLHSGAQAASNKLKDYLVHECAKELQVVTREYIPCMVFLEGEFWGFSWMTPRYEEEFFKYRYNVDDDDLLVMKGSTVEIGLSEDKDALYTSMLTFICNHDMKDPEMYEKACELIDIQSCIDYYATEIYISNVDWPHHNTMLWRTKEVSSGAYTDTKWRWILHDTNISMEMRYAQADMIARAIARSELFASLMENESFAQAIRDKLVELAENNFNPAFTEEFIDDYELFMADAMEKEYARFYKESRNLDSFFRECETVKQFFVQRYDYVMKHYGDSGEEDERAGL